MGRAEQRACGRRKAGVWPAGHLYKSTPVSDPLTNTETHRVLVCIDCGHTNPQGEEPVKTDPLSVLVNSTDPKERAAAVEAMRAAGFEYPERIEQDLRPWSMS